MDNKKIIIFGDLYNNFIVLCQGETTKDLSIAVQMMKRIHSLMEKYPELLQEADRQLIARCLNYLGFDELGSSVYPVEVMFSE